MERADGLVDPWKPKQYLRFREERRQPFFDLLAMVRPVPAMRLLDLGCGTGELTRILHERLQAQETLGIDQSETMLAETRRHAGPGLRFEKADIEAFRPAGKVDLIFSNAALHWLADHGALLGRLTGWLSERGQLAVQVPANHDHPMCVVAAEVAQEAPFREALSGWVRRPSVFEPEAYAAVLHELGYRDQQVRLQVYRHLLDAPEEVVEWAKGALLTAYETRMPLELYPSFVKRYRALLRQRLGDRRPYLFLFKRILFWARR